MNQNNEITQEQVIEALMILRKSKYRIFFTRYHDGTFAEILLEGMDIDELCKAMTK